MGVIVAGSINMDLVLNVPHFPAPGETLTAAGLDYFPGGKGANQAVAIARLGQEVALVSRVGSDGNGPVLLEGLKKNGIDTTHTKVLEGMSSGLAFITVDRSGQNSIVIFPGANAQLSPSDVESAFEQLLPGASIFLTQLEIPDATVERGMTLAKQNGLNTVFNPAPAKALDEVRSTLAFTDILILNETETRVITGVETSGTEKLHTAVEKLHELGPEIVIITLGANGSLLFDHGNRVHLPAPQVEVIDTTAAGDAFIGGFCVALLEERPLDEAVLFGNHAGALAVTRAGAQPSLPTYAEVLKTIPRGV